MTFIPIGPGQTKAHRVGLSLRKRYTEWTVDRKPNEAPIPYLKWNDDGAKTAYWLLCDLWKIPREA